jgi:ParB family transcriptional regulator, chromosome partitioning protein
MVTKNKNSGLFNKTVSAVNTAADTAKDTVIADLRQKLEKVESQTKGISLVDIDLIDPSPYQCRTYFDESKLSELMTSIKEFGVITPLIGREVGDRIELIAGERRLICAKKLGLGSLPLNRLVEISDDQAAKLVLIENLKRADISPVEEVRSVLALIVRLGLPSYDNNDKIASELKKIKVIISGGNKTPLTEEQENLRQEASVVVASTTAHKIDSFLANRLPLIDLPVYLQDLLVKGLEYTKAKALAKIGKDLSESEAEKLAEKAFEDKLSLSAIKKLAPDNSSSNKKKTKNLKNGQRSNSFELIWNQLRDIDSFLADASEISIDESKELETLLDSLKAKIAKG